ncbi:MAG TPA: AraC family transcriptional regulator [Chitinophagaceae bacterium]|nr:AraC family transcriptional regulator [Chitinophagaceae bacterium]
MTFYQQQILSIKNKFVPGDHLCEKIISAKRFIDQNFSNRISLDAIACEACISKFHFLRLFKSLYGRTPHQYLTEVRIEKAKQLLRAGLPVADTCFLTGFESVSSFKALFKRSTRQTPSFYQKRAKPGISQTAYRFLPFFSKKIN